MQTIMAIDQGTTSSRAILFDGAAAPVFTAQEPFKQHYPNDGWVEHDPEEIWASVQNCVKQAINWAAKNNAAITAIGITNQRETCVIWDRKTGQPIYNAIVWQDRRTADICERLKSRGQEEMITQKTGLLLDPYFSASKLAWILDNTEGAHARAEAGQLAAGTIDTFLIWRLTGGGAHLTDATNASRTSLYNIADGNWDDELLRVFGVPRAILPAVKNCADEFGVTTKNSIGAQIQICGVAGDQQAASIGQGCFEPGDMKSTYGTGCFALLNTGGEKIISENRLLTTIAMQLGGTVSYALEGSIFVAGAVVQWLRDEMGLIKSATETETMANTLATNEGLYLVPAFTGMGAPHWDPHARGAIFGITRATGPASFARAALESVCYQTYDLLQAMAADGARPSALNVDGGMVANDWAMQFLADILDIDVIRPKNLETTALGAALLAGYQSGLYADMQTYAASAGPEKTFSPKMGDDDRSALLSGWKHAVSRTLTN